MQPWQSQKEHQKFFLQFPLAWELGSGRKISSSSTLGKMCARRSVKTHFCTFSDTLVGSNVGSTWLDHSNECLASYQAHVLLRPRERQNFMVTGNDLETAILT